MQTENNEVLKWAIYKFILKKLQCKLQLFHSSDIHEGKLLYKELEVKRELPKRKEKNEYRECACQVNLPAFAVSKTLFSFSFFFLFFYVFLYLSYIQKQTYLINHYVGKKNEKKKKTRRNYALEIACIN